MVVAGTFAEPAAGLYDGGAGLSLVCGLMLLRSRAPADRNGRHAARPGPRLATGTDTLAARVAELEDRLGAQDEAWAAWRDMNGSGRAAGLYLVRSQGEGA